MKIIIGGGTGLVGRHLVPALIRAGHQVVVVGRNKDKIRKIFPVGVEASLWDELNTLRADEFEAIINLAGENIGDNRWTPKIKEALLSSRIDATRRFIHWGVKAKIRMPHLYNASAVGIYGLHDECPKEGSGLTETDGSIDVEDKSFSQALVRQWEQAANAGTEANMRVTLMRFGVVLKRGEGMLKKLELPAKYCMGAVVGSGRQPISWVDIDDLVKAILFLLVHPEITGPVNCVAPQFVSQKIFTKMLGNVMKRPALLWLPTWFVKLAFGQMGEELLLSGQGVVPERLLKHQFNFQYAGLFEALTKEFSSAD